MAMAPGTRADPSNSFRFQVEIRDVEVARFSEVGEMTFDQTPEEYAEGGVNSHMRRFPGRFKYGDLTLKKGIAKDGELLWKWFQDSVKAANNGAVIIHPVTITLMDVTGSTGLRSWVFNNAFPIKWHIAAFSADQNGIAIETLTLAHQGINFSE
jgi:phage tail-like protein